MVRVRLKTSSRMADLSQHEADGSELQEGEPAAVEIFPVLGETTATVEPRNGAFDNPSPRQNLEAFCGIGSFDDFGFEIG